MENLYTIDARIMQALAAGLDEETGEILNNDELEALEMEREEKIDQLAFYRKDLLADIAAIEAETKSLTELKKKKEATIARIEKWLSTSLNGEPWKPKCGLYQITFKRSKSTEVYDMDALIAYDVTGQYLNFGKPKGALTAIKKAIDAGENVPGCRIVENVNMQIK